jgi:hypothetical protein
MHVKIWHAFLLSFIDFAHCVNKEKKLSSFARQQILRFKLKIWKCKKAGNEKIHILQVESLNLDK